GALLGTVWIGGLQYAGFNPHIQVLASSVGVLLILWLFPGGLAQIAYDYVRDPLLRAVAVRRGLLVPSLLADARAEKEMEAAQAKALTTAMSSALESGEAEGEDGRSTGTGGPRPARRRRRPAVTS
ncbi:MAG TPA: hypothetical protein VGR90_07930, partial [Acidimicrobiales bacterium]|nr:hypothetical protein [Acidimicrobiales bacterium]